MTMLPDMNLSKFSEVLVGARISKAGNATPQPGDLTGSNRVLEVGDDDVVHLVIDRQRS
jgi:cytochrome c-type biogenesis protein CcmH